jgi:hypothetical protein
MKWIKKFNESSDHWLEKESVIDTCEDILLELEDSGFNCKKTITRSGIAFKIIKNETFTYEDIKDVVERLESYLSDYGLKINWMYGTTKPTISSYSVTNPVTWEIETRRNICEFYFNI